MSSFTAEKQPRPKFRNLNFPLLLSYRLPLPGVVSIMHRMSGAALFLMLPLLLWLFDLSLTSELSFERLRGITSNFFFKLLLGFLVWGFFHHLVA
ncbi:MAG TPA: succinate dehydrogenase, cytochrome b556 subunit, partial [Burkholderiaceae bacterium]|nr:succinate dehydrogenase, cytochrome b556 subunit [Burkholderiaceae bacterium]